MIATFAPEDTADASKNYRIPRHGSISMSAAREWSAAVTKAVGY